MPTVSIKLYVGANEKATVNIPTRKAKILGDDLAPGGTVTEQAQAILDWLVQLGRVAAVPTFGSRDYDVMLAKVSAADPAWDSAKVQQDGIGALETAFDALP